MTRKPAVALATLALLALTACSANRGMVPTTAQARMQMPAAQVMSVLRAEALESGTSLEADKDWVLVEGIVTKLLPDDTVGLKHQHFLFKTEAGKIVKIAHNTDLAPYVPVKVGDKVEVKCEYIKASPNDVAHWTHFDPRGGEGGYIKLNGKIYDRL